MTRIAIIGTGISGMGCAHFLHHRRTTHDGVPIDTGFMVFNEVC